MASPATPDPTKSRKRPRLATVVWIVLAGVLYAASLLGFYWLGGSSKALPSPDLGTTDDTVVLIDLEQIHTVGNQLDVKVLVLPEESLLDQRLGVLNTDIAVRLYPAVQVGELRYPEGRTPAAVDATIDATGSTANWPFDSYTTNAISADVIVGSGPAREVIPARVEVSGRLDDWDIYSQRSGPATQSSGAGDDTTITLRRARGPLAFDLGICLVLVSLPALALFVAIEMLTGRRKFLPPFATWYAAMLFAIVPLRNILPGAPPPGAWVDLGLVLWVLVALVVAMVIYIIAWWRHSE